MSNKFKNKWAWAGTSQQGLFKLAQAWKLHYLINHLQNPNQIVMTCLYEPQRNNNNNKKGGK